MECKSGVKKISHTEWKKQRRKQKRQLLAAKKVPDTSPNVVEGMEESWRLEVEQVNARQNAEWESNDALSHRLWQQRKAQEERDRIKREEIERKIREEWLEREAKEKAEKEAEEIVKREKQDEQDQLLKKATENQNNSSSQWHNPLLPPSHAVRKGVERSTEACPFFSKTGACRFGERCSRLHSHPESSTTILIGGMFANFELIKSSVDDYDTDICLEYEDNELYKSFCDFYYDVVPEFKAVGRVVNVKVCCNHVSHLRGNVYIQYKSESDTNAAFWKFNARWYGGRQLTCQLVSIPKWKSAICGLFFSNKCPKGKECNFMHVFRNPANEFFHADRDFEPTYRTVDSTWRRKHLRRSRSRSRSWRSRSRCRRSRSRCRRSGSRCRRSGRKNKSRSHRSKSKHRSQSPSRGSTTERSRSLWSRSRSRSPRHSSNSPNHGSRLPRHDSTSHRSRSPRYRSRSPIYRSRSPRYRSRSPIHRCRSPRHRVDSPTHRCRLPRDRSMSPGHRFRSPKEISQTLQATYSKKETKISQSPSVHQYPMKRTGTSPDKAAAISATLLPSDKDTCSELLSPVMSKSVPDNSSAECQQATELCCGKDKIEKHKKSKHKKSSKKKKRRKEKRVIENSLHHGCSNRYESAGGDDVGAVGEDGERVDIEDE